jgi:hypothetical protein
VSIAGEVVGLGVDAKRAAGGGVWCCPWRLQSLLIWVGGAPDVHVSLVAGGRQGPTPAITGIGGTAPERTEERVAAVEAADRSRAAPESVGPKPAAPEQGLSDRLVKKPQVRSKM